MKSYNDLIDLKDHCLLCYLPIDEVKPTVVQRQNSADSETSHSSEEGNQGENVPDNAQNENPSSSSSSSPSPPPNCCKGFLTSISRYLRIPYAVVAISVPGKEAPQTIRKRWDNIIKGYVCKKCKPLVDQFRNLFSQITYLELQLDLLAQDIEQEIYLSDKKSSCQAGKKLLESKWKKERGMVPESNFHLLTCLRGFITKTASRRNTLPYVRLKRMVSPVRKEDDNGQPGCSKDVDADTVKGNHRSRPMRAMASFSQSHRPSFNDDSGFSTTTSENGRSPASSLSFDEMDRQFNAMTRDKSNRKVDTMTKAQNNAKEYVVIRRVIRCKKCNLKIMKDKFNEHCQSTHPKRTGESSASTAAISAGPSTENKEVAPNKDRKTAIICPKDDCATKFLEKESFLSDLGLCHRELLPKFSSDSSTDISKNIPHKNDNKSVIPPGPEKLASPSPDIAAAPNPAARANPKRNGGSVIKQGLGQNGSKKNNSGRKLIRGPYLKRKLTCLTCSRKFHNKEDLSLHAQTHLMHQCNFCNTICENPYSTAVHELYCHGDHRNKGHRPIPFQCPRCPEKIRNVNTYKAHFWRTHLNKPSTSFKCFHCQEIFQDVEEFKVHDDSKVCTTIFTSSSQSQSSNDDQEREVIAEPQPGPSKIVQQNDFVCSICNLHCSSFFALKSHIISHDPNIEPCSDCPRLFKNKAQLEKHRSNYHNSEPDPEPVAPAPLSTPAGGIKIVIIRKHCKYCNSRQTFNSQRAFEKHIKKHEDNLTVGRKKRRSPFQNKECPVCKQFFRNLGSHMKAHAIQSGEEENREIGEPDNRNDDTSFDTAGESDVLSHNESAVEMEVDAELLSDADDDDDSSTRRSLAERVKLRQRRASCQANQSIELQLENYEDEEEDEEGYFPKQRGGNRNLSGSRRFRRKRSRNRISGRNETTTDDEFPPSDYAGEKKKSKSMPVVETSPTTAPENVEPTDKTVENQNVDNVPTKEGDTTRQPLVNINSTLPPRSESTVGKVSNNDDQCELARQSFIPNSSLPPKKRPQPPASLPPPESLPPPSPLSSSVSDEQEDTDDSSGSTVILTHGNRPKTASSTTTQLSSSDPPVENVTVQENKTSPTAQATSSSADTKVEPSDSIPNGNTKADKWLETSKSLPPSDKVVEKKPDVIDFNSFITTGLTERVNSFLKNFPGVNSSTNSATNTEENITSPPSPEVITID